MDFSAALTHLKQGRKLTRRGWNGINMWIRVMPERRSHREAMVEWLSYIYLSTESGRLVPMSLSSTDILADDWELVD